MLALVAAIVGVDEEIVRQALVLSGGLTVMAGMAQLLWTRQRQAIVEARQLREETEIHRRAAEREAEQARLERRAAEHERRNAENAVQLSSMQLGEAHRQLELCRESESRLRVDVNRYVSEIRDLGEQVKELRRIIRVRFADLPERRDDPPAADFSGTRDS